MSRRKQARPRLIKREDEEEEGHVTAPSEPEPKRIKVDDVSHHVNGQMADDTVSSEVFRCGTCSATFRDLTLFMDHKNALCQPAEQCQKNPTESRSTTPSSVESHDALSGAQDPQRSDGDTFSCGACSRVFRSRSQRDKHATTHRPSKCTQCGAVFASPASLGNHIRTQHEAHEIYPCQICDLEYPTMAALMSHQNAHKPKPINQSRDQKATSCCQDCGDVFFSDKDKDNHTCPNSGGKRIFQCRHCSAICVGPTALALHCQHAHPETGSEQNKCPLCYKCFLSLDELTAHTKVHDSEPERSPLEARFADYSPKNNSTPSKTQDVLVCPYCFRDNFESIESLEVHMQGIHSVKPTDVYTCNYCNAPYKNLYSLHEHMRAIHQSQPSMGIQYPCSRCDKQFPTIDSLQEHKKRVHHRHRQSETSHVCPHCSLVTLSSSMLQEHIMTSHRFEENGHMMTTPEPKHIKTTRSTTSTPKSTDSLHMVRDNQPIINVPEPSQILRRLRSPVKTEFEPSSSVKANAMGILNVVTTPASNGNIVISPIRTPSVGTGSDAGEEMIRCDQCSAAFTDALMYQKHLKSHTPDTSPTERFECRQCQKVLCSEDELEAHVALHFLSSSAEYSCKPCDKTFSLPDDLQRHLMDIHAHHLYRCALCKQVYDSKVNIQVHFAIQHSGECRLWRCVACDVTCRTEAEWSLHVRLRHLHLPKPYRCLFCKESFSGEMELQCHLATHNKPFKCSMCDEAFLVEFLLDKHLQTAHSPDMMSERVALQVADETKIKRETNSVKQEIPSEFDGLNNTPALKTVGMQSPFLPILTGSGPAGDDVIMFQNYTPGTPVLAIPGENGSHRLTPTQASGSFDTGSRVWKSPEDLYRCNICDKKFSQLQGLQNHKVQDHGVKLANQSKRSPSSSPSASNAVTKGSTTPTTPDVSAQRSEVTNSETQATSLLQDALTSGLGLAISLTPDTSPNAFSEKLASSFSDKLFLACPFCSQTFKCKSDMEKHSKIHLNTGSQKCNICDKLFASSCVLAEHKLTHCKIQQGNVCVACKIPVTSEDQFYMHSQEHGFQGAVMQCIVCRQTLASMLELQMHGRHHFQNKATFYTCCVCLSTFDSCENLIPKTNSSGRNYYLCKPCYHGDSSLFQCRQCDAKFSSASGLEAHAASHKKSYQCIKCQESFSTEAEIQLHVATHMMTEGNAHECFLCCTMHDSPAKLQCHLIEHTFKCAEIRCHVCDRMFNTPADIQTHALEHGVTARKHACGKCNQKFFFSAELENHIYLHKREMTPATSSKMQGPTTPTLTIQPLSWPASNDMSILDASPMYGHLFPSPGSSLLTDSGTVVCPRCDKKFSSVFELSEHFRLMHSESENTSHKCPSCREMFTSMSRLHSHFLSAHTKPGPVEKSKQKHVCSVCAKECSSEHNLLTHMNTHKRSDRHTCAQCGKTFSTVSGLSVHMTSKCHGVPHQCPVCHKRFAKKSAKMDHMKTHSGDKVYPCPTCGMLFTNKAKLQEHVLEHDEEGNPSSSAIESGSSTPDDEVIGSRDMSSDHSNQSGDRSVSDSETDGMKQEVTSTSNIPDDNTAP